MSQLDTEEIIPRPSGDVKRRMALLETGNTTMLLAGGDNRYHDLA